MKTLLQDIRYGLKTMGRNKASSLVLIFVLALGIAGTTTMFSVIDTVILRPLDVRDPSRLIALSGAPAPPGGNALTWWSQSQVFDSLCTYQSGGINLTEGDIPTRIPAAMVSASFFSVFDKFPHIGRPFIIDDERPGHNQVAILSDGLWTRSFARDANIVGRNITLNGIPHTIVGVMPGNFGYPGHTDVWFPRVEKGGTLIDLGADSQADVATTLTSKMVGRLRANVTLSQAQSDLDTLFTSLQEISSRSGRNAGDGVRATPLQELLVRDFRPALLALFAAVGFLLLIACANAASLLLARAATRRKEIAIRLCLGATPRRIIRQLLTESVLLGVISGLIGILLAYWGVEIVRALGPKNVSRLSDIYIDIAALGFTFSISLLVGLVIGLAPALQVFNPKLTETLKEGSISVTGRWQSIRKTIVVVEVALTLVLVLGAGLTTQSFFRLTGVDLGFNPKNLVTMRISLPGAKYNNQNRIADFQQQFMDRIEQTPDVIAAGFVSGLPLGNINSSYLGIEVPGAETSMVLKSDMSGNYFQAIGASLLGGRTFSSGDRQDSTKVVIINETLARLYWEDKNAVGQALVLAGETAPREIVGVVQNMKNVELAKEIKPQIFLPSFQPYRALQTSRDITIVIRTGTDPKKIVSTLRDQVTSIDKDVPAFRVNTMEEVISESIADYRFRGILLSSFAFLALALAATGVYGVVSYSVTSRTREIGIRMSMGARPLEILFMILREGVRLVAIGIILGVAASLGVSRVLSSLLYGVGSTDFTTFTFSASLLAVGVLLSCLIPALRASKVAPSTALRYE
jgi:putative ABC transport system permease protein